MMGTEWMKIRKRSRATLRLYGALLIIYMNTFLNSDWLRAVQFKGNTVPKKEMCKFLKF